MANTTKSRPTKGKLAFQLYTREDGDVGVRIVAANNEVLMSSEGYQNAADAEHLVDLLREGAPDAEQHDLRN